MGPHVLIVDDSALVIGALQLLLEETGHTVSAASTVDDAVSAARARRPDIMLLDLTLKRESGLEVMRQLARTDDLPPVTVALTGHDEPETRRRCVEAGCRDVLVKPIAPLELPRKIRGWLEGGGE